MGNQIPKKCSIYLSFNKVNKNDSPLVYSFAFWSLLHHFGNSVFSVFSMFEAKRSRLHTAIPTVVSSEAVCDSKIHPSQVFFHAKLKPHHLRTSENVWSSKNPTHLAGKEHFLLRFPRKLMNLTSYDHRRGHGAWVRGQINSTR